MGTDGGVVALYGFRYQMLRTMERLLDMYSHDRDGDWAIEIEHATHESVDYAEYRGGRLARVVQVKASRPGSTTRLWASEMQGILTKLAVAFPAAEQVVLESNRHGGWKNIATVLNQQPSTAAPQLVAWHDPRDLAAVEADVVTRIVHARMRERVSSAPEVAGALACLLEARLWQTATLDTANLAAGQRQLTSGDVEALLGTPDRDLEQALGEVSWSTRWHLPHGLWIDRNAALSFLDRHLTSQYLDTRNVACAVLTGFGGLGKSTCAARFATLHADQYAMVIWLTASSPQRLIDEVKELLSHQYDALTVASWDDYATRTALLSWLESTPRSWLLIFDDVDHVDTIRDWIPQVGYGHTLVTSRDAAWPASHAPSLELGILTEPEMKDLVTRRLGDIEITKDGLLRLAQLTDQWALAVDMVLAWLSRTGRNLADLGDYEPHEARQRILEKDDLLPAGYPAPVLHVILDTLAHVQDDNPAAYRLLSDVIAYGATAVPSSLVASDAFQGVATTFNDVIACDDLITELRHLSLIQPATLEDPRLGQYRHRLDVHGLIADMITLLEPHDPERWLHLTERLSLLIETCNQQQDIPLALSLAPVITAIDDAVKSGATADQHYLTLLGNTANIWAVAGNYPVAVYRLVRERTLAQSIATYQPDQVNIFTWLATLATGQLVSILMTIDRPEEAVSLAEEISPDLERFMGYAKPSSLNKLVEGILDAMEAVRHDHLKPRAAAVRSLLENEQLSVRPSPVRAIELALRNDDFVTALGIANVTLQFTTLPVDRIELLCRRAEALATSDVNESDATLREAIACAHENEVDPHRATDLALNTLHQRVVHILNRPITADSSQLQYYRGWFDILDDLVPLPERPLEQAKICTAHLWRGLINDPSVPATDAQQLPQLLQAARASESSTEELIGLHSAANQSLFIHDYLLLPHVVQATAIARIGNTVLLGLATEDEATVATACMKAHLNRCYSFSATRYSTRALVKTPGAAIFLDLTGCDPFSRISGPATIGIVPDYVVGQSKSIHSDHIFRLGQTADLRPDPITVEIYARRPTAPDNGTE
ncbi:hypothetical protein EDL96_04565 [Kocuria soli]|uniref:NB-ARC domain-containing protein n=1 Tax=Kocuria soli TaxID=2485125 RepID=A0A3N3ZYW4_9MICC|nr:hypothetical protein [Kocuria soli]ROZ64053.1 hypothetical protein EDL96_04565 [Kocuria soli]